MNPSALYKPRAHHYYYTWTLPLLVLLMIGAHHHQHGQFVESSMIRRHTQEGGRSSMGTLGSGVIVCNTVGSASLLQYISQLPFSGRAHA